jgi:ribosomal protein L7/L12
MDEESNRRLNRLVEQVGELERRVSFLFGHFGVAYADTKPEPDEIERMVIAGNKMGAINLYKTRHGTSLADAKRAVEAIAARLGV